MLTWPKLVHSSVIHDLGFNSVRTARALYFRRTKVTKIPYRVLWPRLICLKALYDFDRGGSSMAKAQAAILMTYHVPVDEPLMNAYWLGNAIHHAKALGADRFTVLVLKDPAKHNRLKRLWWCCIIRDRTMALSLRRPISIFSPSFDQIWPPLTKDDLKNEISHSCVHGESVKVNLLQFSTALCRFCSLLTDMFPLLYPSDGHHAFRDRLDLMTRVYRCTESLDDWHETVLETAAARANGDSNFNIVVLFDNLLNIYFQYVHPLCISTMAGPNIWLRSARAALCNYRIMLTLNELENHNFERLQSKTVLRSILRSIAQSLRAIIDADMIFYLPIGM